MSKLSVLALSLAACATTGSTIDPAGSQHAKVKLDLAATAADGATPAFPTALEPTVPSVDRIAHSVRARLGTSAVAQLDLCVSPAGKVMRVTLAKTSTFDAFDRALVRDAEAWQFASLPGPDSVQSCRRATIEYRMR